MTIAPCSPIAAAILRMSSICHEHPILLVRAFGKFLICRAEDAAIPKVIRVETVRDQRNRSRWRPCAESCQQDGLKPKEDHHDNVHRDL